MSNPMSPEMVRLLRWIVQHGATDKTLRKMDQRRLKGLAARKFVGKTGATQYGVDALSAYTKAELVSRKAENKDLSEGVSAALALIRMKVKGAS